jgi:hypothetical protein
MNATEAIKAAYTVAENRGFKVLNTYDNGTKRTGYDTCGGKMTIFYTEWTFDIETDLEDLNGMEIAKKNREMKRRAKIAHEIENALETAKSLVWVVLLANGFRISITWEA